MQILSCLAQPQGHLTVRFCTDAGEYDRYIERVYLENRRNFRLPDYPDGKPPRQAIETARGESVFWFDAFNLCIDEAFWPAYYTALDGTGLRPLCRPRFALEQVTADGFSGTACAPLLPAVQLPGLAPLCLTVTPEPVRPAQLLPELHALQQRYAEPVPSGAPLAGGDIALIDYEGRIDGQPFPGGSAQGYRMVMGQNQPFPGFYTALLGQPAGATVLFSSEFPYYMKDESLDGKTAQFSATVRQCFRPRLPVLDDALARQAGYASLPLLRQALLAQHTLQARQQALDRGTQTLARRLAEGSRAALPEPFVGERRDALFLKFKQDCARQPIGWRTVVRRQGLTEEQFQAELLETAALQLRGTAALIRLAEELHLAPQPAGHGALLCDGPEDELWPTEGLTGADRSLVFAALTYLQARVCLCEPAQETSD